MEKELHIYMTEDYPSNTFLTLNATLFALYIGDNHVCTIQPHVCSTEWLQKGYRIFVHLLDGSTKELKLGEVDGREIRLAHNLEKMLLANYFGKAVGGIHDCSMFHGA